MTDLDEAVLNSIYIEYLRQKELKISGKFKYTCEDSPGLTPSQKCVVLTEEVGEVARAILNLNKLTHDELPDEAIHHLRTELIQVAAVAFSWIKGMEGENNDTA